MLSPRYLDGLADELTEIYSQLESEILQDMARRIAKLGKITDASKWQAQIFIEAGGLKKNVSRILAKYDKAIVKQVKDTITDALETSIKNDNRIFKEATGRTVSAPNAQQMLSTIQKCHGDLARLTLTTAATTQTQFVQEANRVYMNVQSGAFDYDSAMKDAVDELAKRGITTVQYENGRPVTRSIESAVRMNILTGVNQTAANQTLSNCEELDCDLVETSAHIGARPEHEEWQGQIFSRSGNNKKYRPFSVCELGSVTGICGINCKHSFYPYFEGMENHYTEKELDEMADEKVTFNEKQMTRCDGEQYLRGIERNIRRYKRQALTQEAAGVDNTRARRKIGEWQEQAKNFTRQTGIARDSAREYVGTKTGKQPTALRGTQPKPSVQPPASNEPPAPITSAIQKSIDALTDNPKSSTRGKLEALRVPTLTVNTFTEQKTETEIIQRLAGGDKTEGSCSSLALAYIANKAGFDVLDFRGGTSLRIFSSDATIRELAQLNGVKSVIAHEYNDYKAARFLMQQMEVGKEYELAVGRHASIVRRLKDGTFEYLELQSANVNGFKKFESNTLRRRFGCQCSHTSHKQKYQILNCLIDIATLGKNKEFIELMRYINTGVNSQLKGFGGYEK
jgi:hypothetical protein